MSTDEKDARIEALEEQVKELQTLLDTEKIMKLQRAYGYYIEHWMAQEIIDCFSDSPDVRLELYEGTFIGKESIIRYFKRERSPEFLHQVMQLSPIVDIGPQGRTAKGRWYGFGACAIPVTNGIRQYFMGGIYETDYIKEHGIWKILKLSYSLTYAAPPGEGWVKPEKVVSADPNRKYSGPKSDLPPADMDSRYPSGFIFPFHYEHPVTGKKTSEETRNATLPFIPSLFSQR